MNRHSSADNQDGDQVLPPLTPTDFAEIVQIFDEAIIVVDSTWRVIFINESAEHLFGYYSTEIFGQDVERLFVTHSRDELRRLATVAGRSPQKKQHPATRYPCLLYTSRCV